MDGHVVNGVYDIDSKSRFTSPSEGFSDGENGMVKPDILVELLSKLHTGLAYSSDKLVNLDLFMANVSLGESEIEELSMGKNKISEVEMEKALVFDLSFGYLDSEVTELGHLLNVLQTKIYDAHQQMHLCGERSEIFDALHGKLHASESSWKHLQDQLLEMKKQLANLRRTLSVIGPESTYSLEGEDLEGSGLDLQSAEHQIHVLRMLEKSLASELDIGKQLLESKEREEALKSKLLVTNNILSNSQVFSEAALERLLEAETSSVISLGIAKEMISRLQIRQFNLHCAVQREGELKLKLPCTNEALYMEAFSEDALVRLLEAEHSSEIFMGIVKEMMSRLQILQFNLHCSAQREEHLKSELLCANEVASEMEAYSEVALQRLVEAQHSSEIFSAIAKEMMSRFQVVQFNLHCLVKREQELTSKLLLTNEAISNVEAFSEVALERLLEAEHSAEIFMGIAKETMSRLQILHFNLHCSLQREGELKSKLQDSLQQLKEKETALIKAKSIYGEIKQSFQEKETLLEDKVKALEEKLQSSESELQEMKASYEASQEQLSMMEDAVQSLREHVFMSESRAHEAEAKLTTLTEENIELREEARFLKDGDTNEKISLLEKQVRDLEMQLQNARVASEASLEQQNMLYMAIWDMETLIEELKSKVLKVESRAESAELALAETNLELNKEISCLKAENEKLKGSLKDSNRTKVARMKEINNGAKLITEMVMQLAAERERIQKKLSSLASENEMLMEELQKTRKNGAKAKQESIHDDEKESSCVMDNQANGRSTPASSTDELGEIATSTAASNQVEEPSEQNKREEAEATGSSTSDGTAAAASCNFQAHENEGDKGESKHRNRMSYCIFFGAILCLLLSILAMNFDLPL